MNLEARIAFIRAQTVLCDAELQMMIATNKERERNGYALSYGPEQFKEFTDRWEAVIGYNAVISFLRE